MSDTGFYVAVLFGAPAGLLRLPGLLRNPHDPLLRSVTALLVTTVAVFFFAATPTIARVNELTGVANFSAPLVYSLLMACSGSGILLLINWRGGSPQRIRRATRWCVGWYAAVIVVLFALFHLGDTPDERLRDFDTHYAHTPYVREMIALYLLAHTASTLIMTSLCRRWLREVSGELRVGLAFLVVGYVLGLSFDLCKLAAVGARWYGVDWDVLSTEVAPPFAVGAAPFLALGFGLPLVVQRLRGPWRDWSRHRRLGPLAGLVGSLTPTATTVRITPLSAPGVRRLRRESCIHDGLLTLDPYFDLTLRSRTHTAALAGGATAESAAADADAAMLLAAVAALRADPERRVITSSRVLQKGAGDISDLVGIARSLSRAGNRTEGRTS
ncbi:MAB_1171c family putative transporter [Streptomyces sp. NPDC101733]|uniref:MAB_1171c family putative transporter n=1 Tax=unclassified Streptomyces TaxID=2593676 RepID=UPI0038296BE0